MHILKSASKTVFVMLALAAVGGFFSGQLSEANFMVLASGAFAFYFGKKDQPPVV